MRRRAIPRLSGLLVTVTSMGEELRCEWCDASFQRPHKRGPRPKFCSASHRQRAHEARQAEALWAASVSVRSLLEAATKQAASTALPSASKILAGNGLSSAVNQLTKHLGSNKILSNSALSKSMGFPAMNALSEVTKHFEPSKILTDSALSKSMALPATNALAEIAKHLGASQVSADSALSESIGFPATNALAEITKHLGPSKISAVSALSEAMITPAQTGLHEVMKRFAEVTVPSARLITEQLGSFPIATRVPNLSEQWSQLIGPSIKQLNDCLAPSIATTSLLSEISRQLADAPILATTHALAAHLAEGILEHDLDEDSVQVLDELEGRLGGDADPAAVLLVLALALVVILRSEIAGVVSLATAATVNSAETAAMVLAGIYEFVDAHRAIGGWLILTDLLRRLPHRPDNRDQSFEGDREDS